MTVAGVRFLDHTADVGIAVEADSLAQLLDRSARGMLALLCGEEDEPGAAIPVDAPGDARPDGSRAVPMELGAAGPTGLVAAWLRELLFLHEVRGQDYAGLEIEYLDERRLVGRALVVPGGRAVREIKGVTYHGLAAERAGAGWRAEVIFDV